MKFGVRYHHTALRRVSQINENGTFRFNTDLSFDPANPRTYPERLTIRVGEFEELLETHTFEAYAQDKWKLGERTTLSVGLRYDLERIPIDVADNPLFSRGQKAPVDANNFLPRIGFTHALDAQNRSVVRGGYGIFYNRTILGAIDDTLEFGRFTNSIVATFPNDSADPGPAAGRLPTDPFLVNGPFINQRLLDQLYPPGTRLRNDEVRRYLETPISDAERQQVLDLVRWFRRRYPTGGERLAYVRKAYARWTLRPEVLP